MALINDRGAPTFDAEHRFTGYIGSCMDVTEKVEGRKLIDLAHYDTLTSVFNRNYLEILTGPILNRKIAKGALSAQRDSD